MRRNWELKPEFFYIPFTFVGYSYAWINQIATWQGVLNLGCEFCCSQHHFVIFINPWIGESPPYLMGITQKPIKKGSGYCHSWARKREFKGRHDQRCQNFGEAKEKNYWLIITKSFSEAFYQVSSSNGDLDINTISQKLWALGRVWGPSMPFRGQADCFYYLALNSFPRCSPSESPLKRSPGYSPTKETDLTKRDSD